MCGALTLDPVTPVSLPRNRFCVGYSELQGSAEAGAEALAMAMRDAPGRPPDCLLMFSTSRHDPHQLLKAVRAELSDVPVYGGYAVGVIAEERLGYDGFQVGIAAMWLDGGKLDVFIGRHLNDGEALVGEALAGQLAEFPFSGDPSLLLLYDSVNRTGNRLRLNMATTLLKGGLTRLPAEVPLMGAGLVGDMQLRPTFQWTGHEVESQTALMLAFHGGLEIEQIVLHGCRPASAYHRVTRVDENVVLEIDNRPALDVVAELLGPHSGRSWQDYRFFVTLGVNKGDKYAPFDPNLYANRMCMAVDMERRGLVMFEPDLVAGDLVQLMLREVEFSYIGTEIGAQLERLAPRKPVFALYIDCAGRASAYSHLEEEEARYVQAAMRDVCPLLGFYSGVEVARVKGVPQALDWTGVLCCFFEREVPPDTKLVDLTAALPSPPAEAGDFGELDGVAPQDSEAIAYYRDKLDEAAGDRVRFDARLSSLNRGLRQREEGFRVLANLRQTLDVRNSRGQIYAETLKMVLANMAIERALVLEADAAGKYSVAALSGYPEDIAERVRAGELVLPEVFEADGVFVGNRRDKSASLEALRGQLRLPCLVGTRIPGQRRAALILGREREIKPFFPPFDEGDVANYQAIASFLGSVVENVELYAAAEQMAASFRRFVPEAFLKILNRQDFKDIELGDQIARHMTVLVTDIRSFSTLSERMTPQQVFTFVNEFLAETGPVIRAHNGFVNKYIGDAIMALFETADDGLNAAVALTRSIDAFNDRRRREGKFPIQIGIAVHSGEMMLGAIGEAERLEGSVLADAVNLCFRLEGLTKVYGAQILTTDDVMGELTEPSRYLTRSVDLVTVKGRRNHVAVIEILDGLPEERRDRKLATRDLYQSGFQNFEFGGYEEAARAFREVARLDPEDRAARAMFAKSRKLAEGDAPAPD